MFQLLRLSAAAPGALVTGAVVLLVAALRVAAWQDQRASRRWREEASAAAARADVARALGETIADPEVRSAWDVVCDALRQGWLADAGDVAALAAELERGDTRRLMEEASIGPDDDAPAGDRVALHHVGLVPEHRSCPRGLLVADLGRLAAALDRAAGSSATG